jgi:iron complex outermembrane recepter protein
MCKHQKPARQREMSLITRPKLIRMLCTGLGIGLVTIAAIAGADEAAHQYRIPAQSLDSSLLRIAADSGLEILFTADKVRGVTSNPIDGNMTPAQALSQLLQDSGMTYRFVDAKTVTIDAPSSNLIKTASTGQVAEPQTNSEGQMMPKVTVEAEADAYDPVNTAAPYNKSYAASNARTATKTDTPIMETPVSIQVVPRAVIDDQQAISVGDAIKNVSGVQAAGYGFYDNFILRGFQADTGVFRNGLRYSNITSLETANLDRIEVLKGPSAVLFGRAEPGGLVNLTTKRPLEEAYYSIQQQFGSYDLFRTTIDATGPVLSDRSLLYRMNLAYNDNNSFQDFVTEQSVFVAPSLTWRPNDKFVGNLDIEYQHNEFIDVSDIGIPPIGNRPASIPLTRFLGDPAAKNVQDRILVGLDWTYEFNDDWKLTNRFQYNDSFYDQNTFYANEFNPATGLLSRGYWQADMNRTNFATNLDLTGHFKTGFLEHDVLVGFDYYRIDQYYKAFSDVTPLVPAIDIFNPRYGIDISSITSRNYNSFGYNPEQWYGVYFQDQITLWDKVYILGGGRHDWAEVGGGSSGTSLAEADKTIETDRTEYFSPRVGIVFQPWHWLSLYGNYVESIGSNNGDRALGGGFLPPQTAQQWEVGVKTELFDGKLNSTLAFFDLTKQNVSTPIPGNPQFSRAIGEENSRGVELDIAGQLTENLSLIGSYAYTDASVTRDDANPSTQGNRLASVPRNSGSLWAKWEFGDEFIRGLSLGTGVYVRGTRSADINVDSSSYVQLPGYARWDASVGYSFKYAGTKMTTQLNVYNILDKDYYDRADTSLLIQPGAPLTFLGSVRMEF